MEYRKVKKKENVKGIKNEKQEHAREVFNFY